MQSSPFSFATNKKSVYNWTFSGPSIPIYILRYDGVYHFNELNNWNVPFNTPARCSIEWHTYSLGFQCYLKVVLGTYSIANWLTTSSTKRVEPEIHWTLQSANAVCELTRGLQNEWNYNFHRPDLNLDLLIEVVNILFITNLAYLQWLLWLKYTDG